MSVDLTKGQSVDLTKEDGSAVKKIRLGGGWDPAADGKDFDVDLFAVDENGNITFFNKKEGIAGVVLDEDNLTGDDAPGEEGTADENIRIDVEKLTSKKVVLAANIFKAGERSQNFGQVKNLFVEIEDIDAKKIVAKYNVSEDGGTNTAVVIGEVENVDGKLKFTAKGEYTNGDINEVSEKNKPTV